MIGCGLERLDRLMPNSAIRSTPDDKVQEYNFFLQSVPDALIIVKAGSIGVKKSCKGKIRTSRTI